MDNIYNAVINFYDDKKIDYKKIKLLLESNLNNGQNQFYISANNFSCSYLSSEQRKDYYKKMVELMPDETSFILELNFDSISDYQEIISQLEKNKKKFKLLIKNYDSGDNDPVLNYKEYLYLFKFLDENNLSNFYLNIDSRNLSTFSRSELLKVIRKINDLEGIIISPYHPYDLDIDEVLAFKEQLNGNFSLLDKADDFYYLNLENGFKTVSKYFNLLPNLFKKINREFKQGNFLTAKEYQLKLNDFIISVNKIGEEKSFEFLLPKILDFEKSRKNSLNSSKQQLLLTKFNKLNGVN